MEKQIENRYSENAEATNWEEFLKVIRSRRSVRVFNNTPIPESDMRDCLKAALLAPNSSNLQPWEFHWVRSPEKKQKLIEACLSQSAARTAAELIVCVARTDTWKRSRNLMLESLAESKAKNDPSTAGRSGELLELYYRKLVPFVYNQGPFGIFGAVKGIGFAVAGLFRPIVREPVSPSGLRLWAVKTTALACENLMLALRAKGYDSCPMEGMDSSRVRKILGLPARSTSIVMVIGAGQRKPEGVYGPQIRFDEKLFLHEH